MIKAASLHFRDCLSTTPQGLYCKPGDFWIDPKKPVPRAVISHGHSDHACRGHGTVLASRQTLAIMQTRMGSNFADRQQVYDGPMQINEVRVSMAPAGHILGAMQICLIWQGRRIVFSGDYKRSPDPTCAPFEVVPCDLFITEATFGLPIFQFDKAEGEVTRLLTSVARNPDRAHLLGAYSLGKAQRLIALIRAQADDVPIFIQSEATWRMCQLYKEFGIKLGDLQHWQPTLKQNVAGRVIICLPQFLHEPWTGDGERPLTSYASGWLRVGNKAQQRHVNLPLVISDHGDWNEILRTVKDTGAEEVWVTHGREDALLHQLAQMKIKAKALTALARADEDE